MKKIYSLFILSILALTMFVGCQMPTDGTETTDTLNVSVNESRTTVDFDVQKTATVNETVVLTIKTSDEVDVKVIKVISKDEVPVNDCQKDSTKKYFTMPAEDVEITVTLKDVDDIGDGEEVEEPVDNTPIVADFVDATDYDVYKDGNFLATIKGKILNAICKNEGFAKDTDYTIEGNKVTVITGSRLYDWLTPQNLGGLVSDDEGGNGNGEGGTETTSETYDVFVRASEGYSLGENTSSESGKEVELSIMTSEGNTPGFYLVKVYITDSNNNDIKNTVDLKVENNKIKFTMPSTNVDVFASFEDVVCRREEDDDYNFPNFFAVTTSNVDTVFQIALKFNTKEYDNLELFSEGLFIYKFSKKPDAYNGLGTWHFYIQLGKDYNVYDYNTKYYKYYENPVVIYNGEMYEPVIDDTLGNRYVILDSQN